jgi:hypothetical protein
VAPDELTDEDYEDLDRDDLLAAEAEDTRHDPENWATDESEGEQTWVG